jgi:hypothetical protein
MIIKKQYLVTRQCTLDRVTPHPAPGFGEGEWKNKKSRPGRGSGRLVLPSPCAVVGRKGRAGNIHHDYGNDGMEIARLCVYTVISVAAIQSGWRERPLPQPANP